MFDDRKEHFVTQLSLRTEQKNYESSLQGRILLIYASISERLREYIPGLLKHPIFFYRINVLLGTFVTYGTENYIDFVCQNTSY
jgi:hypothetical protein